MKNVYALCSILFLAAWSLQAQPTCENPEVALEDGAENYAAGDVTMQSPNWAVWPGGDASGAVVTDEEANGGVNSFKIDGSVNTDALLLLGDQTSGHYILQWDMLVPEGKQGYFNLQHLMPTEASGAWAFEVFFTEEGVGRLELYDGSDDVAFSYPVADWFTVFVAIDLGNDEARLIVNERLVDGWQFSTGSTEALQMNSINFYPGDETYLFYIDNIKLSEIPAAEEGQYCYTAMPLAAPGSYPVPKLTCFGAGADLAGNSDGFAGYWFSYTPSENGVLSISSCGTGAGTDTRGWIFSGECHDLKTVGVNDDRCDRGDGRDYSSYREAYATAGTTYYIMWDNVWDDSAINFELGFTATEDPAAGKFCQSALEIGPGEYTILEITGEAAVGGPYINNTSASITSYTQSEWYAFTPEADGYMGISSCELAASDTYFFVYTGDCSSFETLERVAENDDGCLDGDGNIMVDAMSSLDSIPVTAGTTYYIEWIDRRIEQAGDGELFAWTLSFDPLLSVSEAELDASVQVFPNPASEQLNVRYAFDETVDILNIQLVDVLGQSLRNYRLNSVMAGTEELNLRGLPAGMYLLRLSADGAVVTRPVVVR